MSTDIATRQDGLPVQDTAAIFSVIERAAMNPDVNIDKMERLMAMAERMEAKRAEAAFNTAMAEMQSELPSIVERGKTNNGKYATFEDINDVVKPIMKQFGFAISFRVETVQGGLKVTGVLMHRDGHREETTMLLPLDTSGNKNAVQAVGSSTSYGKRYVMSALLNITTRGEDDDGQAGAPGPKVTPVQAKRIEALLARANDKARADFAENYGVATNVPKANMDKLCAWLERQASKAAPDA